MLVKISMEVSPYGPEEREGSDKKKMVEIVKNPDKLALDDEFKQHLLEVLFVFFEIDKVEDFLGMNTSVSDVQEIPISVHGKQYIVKVKVRPKDNR